jgi:DNA-dependent protein kinase catalytic subunit
MDKNDIKKMLNIIIERCEQIFFLSQQQQQQQTHEQQQTEIFDEKIYQLPSFLESLSYVCNEIDGELPEGCVQTLEKLVILTVEMYPKLKKRCGKLLCIAILSLIVSVRIKKSLYYPDFLTTTIYQCLMRIFSCKTNYYYVQDERDDSEADQLSGFKNKQSSTMSMDYMDLFKNLLDLSQYDELGLINMTIYDKKHLIALIHDEYVESVLKILKKLDLNATRVENQTTDETTGFASSNPIHGLKPQRPRDFEILINLVDFTRELLIEANLKLFDKWMFRFVREIIVYCNNYPFISAFYKLNTLAMRIAVKIDYFNVCYSCVLSLRSYSFELVNSNLRASARIK